jgi:hypothetical protein
MTRLGLFLERKEKTWTRAKVIAYKQVLRPFTLWENSETERLVDYSPP